jgi:ribosomal protein L14E/L6E/L27E
MEIALDGEITPGTIVRSGAGRDKGAFMIVVANDGATVLVVDGKARKAARPKRKKIKHIKPTRKFADGIDQIMERNDADALIRKILIKYNNPSGTERKTIEQK